MQYLGAGQGAYEREVVKTYGSYRCRPWCMVMPCLLLILPIGMLFWHFWPRAQHNPPDCITDFHDWLRLWTEERKAYCCKTAGRACGAQQGVYRTPPVVYRHVQAHYDCHAGYSNWYFGWSDRKKSWCCDRRSMGCPGTWHGSYHIHTHVMAHGVGHAQGRIYDCDAGFSRWMTGWSDSKKDWCCNHQSRGCVKFHCTAGGDSSWAEAKRSWCCSNVQKGCPRTTLSPLKCKTPCTLKGQTSTCLERIQWVTKNTYSGKEAACNLAYSRVQVECDVCRGCSIQEAGCEVHAGKDPFDCNAALNNFFRAWSPEKKHWCCTKQGKGCEGSSPPSVDPGFGMIWKHVQVNGYWTWQTVHAAGGVHTKLPYDCHAGLNNWQSGWSGPKKSWCCSHQQLGCGGAATDVQSGSWNHGGDHIVHHVVHHVYHYRSRGSPSIPR
ncbi:Uncharacterized protein SCF082_LOCUS16696 [Durusdinium trenchii]|uniref:Cellulase n=1 Tax=Durusdinium trenchii TaxID=1381693 RepID=A0ABP0KDB5_9DINO